MVEQSTIKAAVSCVVAVIMIIGFTAAPAAALTQDTVDDDTVEVDGVEVNTADSDGGPDGVNVRIARTNSPVQTGEQLNVTVDAESENGGTVEFLVDGEVVETRSYPGNYDGNSKFTWETSYDDAGEHEVVVRSSNKDSETVEVQFGADAPEETCTNVPKEIAGNIPFEEFPSQDELPEEVPNPIPPFLTPQGITNLVVGAAPNQCEVQDPNDPSVQPTDPPSDPGAKVVIVNVGESNGGATAWFTYEATLDKSGDGPSVEGSVAALAYPGGVDAEPDATVNDGAHDYTVDPAFEADDSNSETSLRATAPFGEAGATLDCYESECHPSTTGLVTFFDYPAIPAPIWGGEDD